MKVFSKKSNINLRTTFKLLSGALVLLTLLGVGYGYQRLSHTQNLIEKNLAERNDLLDVTHRLRTALLDVYQGVDAFLLEPANKAHSRKVAQALQQSLEISKQLSARTTAMSEEDRQDFGRLHKTLGVLNTEIKQLIAVRLDSSQQYPSLAVGATIMQPNRNIVNNAFALALNSLNGEEKPDNRPDVLAGFIQARHLWTQVLSNFRLYLANRVGSFNESALSLQEKGIDTMYAELKKALALISPWVDEEVIGFETTDAYEAIKTSAEKWYQGFQKVKQIHATNEWRRDAQLMKDNIAPTIEQASQSLRTINSRLVAAAENDVAEVAQVASLQNIVLWLVASIAVLYVLIVFVSVEKLVLRPVSMIVSALKKEATGKSASDLPTFCSNETKELIDAFSEMSRQITLRQSELEHRALHDSLTSLPNRSLLFDHVEHDIFIARRDQSPLALLMIDLDLFKEVNDTFGHAVGDQLLIKVGERFKSILRDGDTVARMGGDEFAVLLPGADMTAAAGIARKLLKASQLPYEIGELNLVVAASTGIAIFPEHGEDAKTLLQHADVAMYVAKQNKLGYSLYDPEQDHYSKVRFAMTTDLRESIEKSSLMLYFQPKLDLRTRQVLGVEALLRWQHPEHGFVSPETIVELAENTGFISQLTYWVVDKALETMTQWQKKDIHLELSINISAHNLLDESFVSSMKEILARYSLPYDLLTLELTENAMMSNPLRAIETLSIFSDMGLGISVDDYGTGFSSLSYLSKLPVNELKIDKSFVMSMDRDASNETIVRSTIELAHSLGLKVVAEGIESELIWNMLRSYGCDQAQGYHMSKPIPALELENWLKGQQRAVG